VPATFLGSLPGKDLSSFALGKSKTLRKGHRTPHRYGFITVAPSVENWAMPPTNSKNCVARTIVNGIFEALIRFSWAIFARNNHSPAGDRCQQLTGQHGAPRQRHLPQQKGFGLMFEEVQYCRVLPRRRVRYVNDNLSTCKRFG
jgi:hypothetical protein